MTRVYVKGSLLLILILYLKDFTMELLSGFSIARILSEQLIYFSFKSSCFVNTLEANLIDFPEINTLVGWNHK